MLMQLNRWGERWSRDAGAWSLVFASWLVAPVALPAAPITEVPKPSATEDAAAPPAESALPQDIGPATPAPAVSEVDALAELEGAMQAFTAGDVAKCEEQLRAAYAKQPNLPPPKLMFARLVLAAGNFDAGRRLLEEVAISHPQHPELYLLFGQMALHDRHLADAAVHFEKAVALPSPEVWTDAQRQYLQNECLSGQTTVAELRGDWNAAAKIYQQRVASNAKDGALRDRLATALFRAGLAEQAFEQFDVAYRQDTKMNRPEVSMAVMCVAEGNYRQADRWFQKALTAHAKDPRVHLERSIALMFEDRADEAEKFAAQAAQLGLASPELHALRGSIALQQGDFARAEEHFRAHRAAAPESILARSQLAVALVEQKPEAKRQEALQLARQLVGEQPQNPDALSALGWVLFRRGELAEAEQNLRQAAITRADSTTLFFLARALRQLDKARESELIARQLQSQLDQPSVFPFRPGVRKWLTTVLDDKSETAVQP